MSFPLPCFSLKTSSDPKWEERIVTNSAERNHRHFKSSISPKLLPFSFNLENILLDVTWKAFNYQIQKTNFTRIIAEMPFLTKGSVSKDNQLHVSSLASSFSHSLQPSPSEDIFRSSFGSSQKHCFTK